MSSKVLIISTAIYQSASWTRYAGIERLALYHARGLAERGHKVILAAVHGSVVPRDVELIEYPTGDFVEGEKLAYFRLRGRLPEFDAILDFSHSHWAMRQNRLPAGCFIWHDPAIVQPPLPTYGVHSLSDWQRRRLVLYQNVQSEVSDCHCAPTPPVREAQDHFVFIGRVHPTKGMGDAVDIAREAGCRLFLIGGLGKGDDPAYLEAIRTKCGGGSEYVGECSDEAKNELLSTARALVYPIAYPPAFGEAHSHKSVDSLSMGVPVIAYPQGAFPEVFGEQGLLFPKDRAEFVHVMQDINTTIEYRRRLQARAASIWSFSATMDRAEALIKKVAR